MLALVLHSAAWFLGWADDPVDPVPDPEDVTAGWLGLTVFLLLVVAVALLGWSLSRQLKKTARNAEAGVFDPSDPARRTRQEIPAQPTPPPGEATDQHHERRTEGS